ncbi:flavodoxin family protein [Clostridium aestuarii]|uniref:Flavodoxin family protein n=1 Tax=Clostridium aestuarii TaxID=338193 RepID=A0ABT4CYP1_9CLOT|nr:flavodoxin family protein [Clostridium aestuarii]MCY6484099.1 flavodoxin family protein [Clostridium aestuarii]
MKVTVVFHSVCGNTYLMAKEIYKNFLRKGIDAGIYRVKDDDLKELSHNYPIINEYLDEILQIPIIDLETILESDYIFLGSPTYFGNVSAEMKAFMDSFSPLWSDGKLFGKKLVAFTSCGDPQGGGQVCLRSINTFAQHMGMLPIPIPANLSSKKSYPAYGMMHCSGDMGDNRLDECTKDDIKKLINLLVKKQTIL